MKRFIAILMIITIMVAGSSVAFAKNNGNGNGNGNGGQGNGNSNKHENQDKAQILYDLGLFKGTSTTSFVPELDSVATRAQAIVLIGTSLGWPKENITTVEGYDDVPSWAAPYVAYALENNITKGVGNHKFGADLPVNLRMIYTWYYRALLFTEDSWKNTEYLVSAGLITQEQADAMKAELTGLTDSAAIRDQIVGIMFDSLQWKENGSNQKLIQKLVNNKKIDWKKAKDLGVLPEEETELTFEVKANTLKTVSVEFNLPLNATTVTASLFEVKVDSVAKVATTDYTVETVDKTVYIIFNTTLAQGATVSVNVKEGIKSTNGLAVVVATKTAVVSDSVLPIVKNVEVTSPSAIKVTFSEPMNVVTGNITHDDILIDGVKAVGTSTLNTTKTVLTLALTTPMSGGSHEIKINAGLLDFAGLKTVEYKKTYVNPLDTTSPSVASVTATERDKVIITFDEPIDKTVGLIFVGQDQYSVTAATFNGNVATLPLTTPLTVDSAITGTTLTIKGIKDLNNNVVDTINGKTITFKATADLVAPTATVSVLTNKTIQVQFSEAIDGFSVADYTIIDTTGVTLPSTVSYNPVDKKAIITFVTVPATGTTFTLSIIDTVLDNSVYQNKFVPNAYTLTISN